MKSIIEPVGRRNFLKTAAAFTSGMAGLSLLPSVAYPRSITSDPDKPSGDNDTTSGTDMSMVNDTFGDDDINIIGPKEGYSPQIGTLVSMMTWMRMVMESSVKGMKMEQLDFLLDNKANTVGAMMYHLAATDAFYHAHTFGGVKWGGWDKSLEAKFGVAMELGDAGRKNIKGNNLDFYLNLLKETRESTLAEFRKRDDKWLMSIDKEWPWGPTNNYCKWFHVCEHESNHNGQIKFLKSRMPGTVAGKE
jgi:hypothetical protein